MSVAALRSRVQKLEQARRASVYAAMWSGLADQIQAEIDGGRTDPDMPGIVRALRRWISDGNDTLWQRQSVLEYGR
jgi:hypothetical protein